MARGLARAGARVGILGRREGPAREIAAGIAAGGGDAIPLPADVLQREGLEAARATILGRWARIDILVNAAGGNVAEATVGAGRSFLDLPSQVFGEAMTRGAGEAVGSIVNISSMAADRALTRVVGYGVAKAGIVNLTRWLAVELARAYGPGLRVNAIAPGFFIGEQNRALLLNEDGTLTDRGRTIIDHTPAGRFGEPEDLVSTLLWLCGPGARFVTGVVVPVDGGFSAFSGV
jgi:NAD(P)-dependent dehydrogenase (short-subunit alcohol dehydrogenase family)